MLMRVVVKNVLTILTLYLIPKFSFHQVKEKVDQADLPAKNAAPSEISSPTSDTPAISLVLRLRYESPLLLRYVSARVVARFQVQQCQMFPIFSQCLYQFPTAFENFLSIVEKYLEFNILGKGEPGEMIIVTGPPNMYSTVTNLQCYYQIKYFKASRFHQNDAHVL